MGIGLLNLVSRGEEDLYLTSKPEVTFFKMVYKKHTNFSCESINQFFKTTPDFGNKVSLTISKNADLLGEIYLNVELPSIDTNLHSIFPPNIKKFKWVDKIGLALIKYISVKIGGVTINRLYGDWMYIYNELNLQKSQYKGYNYMIGDIDLLKNYSNGKENYTLKIPINFWFCKEPGLYLPLVSLYHHDVMIEIEFNPLEKLYKETPNKYVEIENNFVLFKKNEIIEQIYDGNRYTGKFIYFDRTLKKLYYEKLNGDFEINSKFNLIGTESKFEASIKDDSIIINDEPYFKNILPSIVNSYLLVNYIYLDSIERKKFRFTNHRYLVPLVENVTNQIINSNNFTYKLNLKNPSKLIVWKAVLDSNLKNNDKFNYSTYPLTEYEENIIESIKLVINSVERVQKYDSKYFTQLERYKSKLYNFNDHIYLYSFSLSPFEYQPSGSMNFSKIDDAYLQISLNKDINYKNPVEITAYNYNYNILNIMDGLGGLGYYS